MNNKGFIHIDKAEISLAIIVIIAALIGFYVVFVNKSGPVKIIQPSGAPVPSDVIPSLEIKKY